MCCKTSVVQEADPSALYSVLQSSVKQDSIAKIRRTQILTGTYADTSPSFLQAS